MTGRPPKKVADMRGHMSNKALEDRQAHEDMLFDYAPLVSQAPSWLDPLALQEWARIVPLLKKDIPISELDATLIASHCQAYSDIQRATEQEHKLGMVLDNGRANPAVKQVRDATAQMIRTDSELGLTAFSRTKTHAKGEGKQPDDPSDKMVNQS